jgi:hypothetical protein
MEMKKAVPAGLSAAALAALALVALPAASASAAEAAKAPAHVKSTSAGHQGPIGAALGGCCDYI